MGNTLEEVLAQRVRNDKMMHCPNCKNQYNLTNKIPKMVCSNQHNLCGECLQQLKPTNCPGCNQLLWAKKDKNLVICYILEMVSKKNRDKKEVEVSPMKRQNNRYNEGEPSAFNTIDSSSKKTIRMKTVRQQSIPNLNLEHYKQQQQFKKKYSVANIFSISRMENESFLKNRNKQYTFEQLLSKISEEHHTNAFKEIIDMNKPPEQVETLDFTLSRMTRIFDFIPKFTSLTKLNLTKNKIGKIENLSSLSKLTYLSLSDNQIEYIQNLDNLTHLRNLYLNKNKIKTIQNLNNLKNLQFLGISSNSISKIQGLNNLNELRWLNLDMNYINKIEGIAHIHKLEIIHLSSNDITVIEGLSQLPALKEVYLDNNKIQNVKAALSLKNLRKLRLDNNPGLHEDNNKQYERLLQYLDTKRKQDEKNVDQKQAKELNNNQLVGDPHQKIAKQKKTEQECMIY